MLLFTIIVGRGTDGMLAMRMSGLGAADVCKSYERTGEMVSKSVVAGGSVGDVSASR